MIWILFTMDGNRIKGKWLIIEVSLKWVKTNITFLKISPWQIPTVDGMIMTSLLQLWWLQNRGYSNA